MAFSPAGTLLNLSGGNGWRGGYGGDLLTQQTEAEAEELRRKKLLASRVSSLSPAGQMLGLGGSIGLGNSGSS
jgi:hypothetical protein